MILAGWARIRRRALSNDAADAILQAWRQRQTTSPATWTELQTRLQASAAQVDTIPLGRAVHALAKVGYATGDLLDQLSHRSMQLPPVSSSFLVDLADTFGRAGRPDRDLFRTVSLRLATPNALVGRLSPSRSTTLLVACARVGFADPHLFGAVCRDVLAHVDVLPLAFMSRLVWALARTRMATCCDASRDLARAVLARLLVAADDLARTPGTPTTTLTDLMWAYGVVADAIDRRPQARQLVGVLARLVQPRLARTSPHSLASALWAAATLHVAGDDDRPPPPLLSDDFLQEAADIAAAQVPTCRSNSCIAILAWSVARLRVQHNALFGAVAALPPPRWSEFRPADLNMATWALAQQLQEAADPARYDDALVTMTQAALQQLDRYRPADLCSLLCTLTQLRHRTPLFDDAVRRLERDVDQLDAKQRARLLSALLDDR